MPGLVKIGETRLETPQDRVDQFSGTDNPATAIAQYGIWIEEHKKLEKKLHDKLDHLNAKNTYVGRGVEWFHISLDEAISHLLEENTKEIKKTYDRYVNLEKAEILRRKRVEEAKKKQLKKEEAERKERQQEEEERQEEEENYRKRSDIHARYEKIIQAYFSPGDYWPYWVGSTIAIWIILAILGHENFFLSLILGALTAYFWQAHVEGENKSLSEYKTIKNNWEIELKAIDEPALLKNIEEVNFESLKGKFIGARFIKNAYLVSLWIIAFFAFFIIIFILMDDPYEKTLVAPESKTTSQRKISDYSSEPTSRQFDLDENPTESTQQYYTPVKYQRVELTPAPYFKSEYSRKPTNKPRSYQKGDLRHCLNLPTKKEIINCTEQ